ncbi:putative R3H domain protein [Aspergillus lucknowensis]|uniref:R3H domain protein n=1 Tax=Aspergillus lucknowensis TaxID=176173 RepID=A0ABR4M6G6_9EURO
MIMTSKTSLGDGPHLSFAKIAALPPRFNPEVSLAPDENDNFLEESSSSSPQGSADRLSSRERQTSTKAEAGGIDEDADGLSRAVQAVDISEKKGREIAEFPIEDQENVSLRRENSFEDDRTHLSNSSTKPTSFDSKSMASVTTFAMDEKDSLRPDDSASVQAIDEEESLSGHASGAPNSLTGSEAGARFKDTQRHRVPLHNTVSIFSDGSQRAGVSMADSLANNFVVAGPDAFSGRAMHGFPSEPDEKLIEAMKSPKDRLLILQLEEKVRNFIQNSEEQSLELPPSNAFGRLLAHKLGDYYHLTHFVDNNVTSVRLHRTPFCRLPTPLSMIHAAANSTPPSTIPAMKIMRRADGERPSTEGSIAASSSVPSKATSEAGDSGNEAERSGSATTKDRLSLTREEREAKYQEARERIFRDFSEAKTPDMNGDHSTDVSRSSSTSGRKKAHRQKTPHDDSFEARSQFNAYYPGMQYNSGSLPYNMGMHDPSFSSQPYMVGPGVIPNNMGYVPSQSGAMYPGQVNVNATGHYQMPVSPQMGAGNPWQNATAPPQSPYASYSMNQSPAMTSAKPVAAMNNYPVPNSMQFQSSPPGWSSPPYQAAYPQPTHRNQAPIPWPNYPPPPLSTTSYPYTQYPSQPLNSGVPNHPNTHPLPGSFNRSHFNPQTRSFVPGGAAGPGRHQNKSNSTSMGSYPSMQGNVQNHWNGYQDPSSKSQELAATNMPRGPLSGSKDSIAKWGTPSHLPPKPPPSEVPSDFELKHRNGNSASPAYTGNTIPNSINGPLVVSGGTGLARPN